jgi:hypothetical protein
VRRWCGGRVQRFLKAFGEYCTGAAGEHSLPAGLNLGVAKDISKIDVRGPVADYIERQRQLREAADAS